MVVFYIYFVHEKKLKRTTNAVKKQLELITHDRIQPSRVHNKHFIYFRMYNAIVTNV